jgi:hypothetical protein
MDEKGLIAAPDCLELLDKEHLFLRGYETNIDISINRPPKCASSYQSGYISGSCDLSLFL